MSDLYQRIDAEYERYCERVDWCKQESETLGCPWWQVYGAPDLGESANILRLKMDADTAREQSEPQPAVMRLGNGTIGPNDGCHGPG